MTEPEPPIIVWDGVEFRWDDSLQLYAGKSQRRSMQGEPRQYRRGRDGTLKPVVSKGCKGCHKAK